MKLAVISDLHRTHWVRYPTQWQAIVDSINRALDREQPDYVLDAGDAETDVAEFLNCKLVLSVLGNHDWYGEDFSKPHPELPRSFAFPAAGGDILGCTLWTDYNKGDPITMSLVNGALVDQRWITNFSPEAALAEHTRNREFLLSRHDPVVVMTHHAPSFQSVHPRFNKPGTPDQLINYGFVSDLEDFVGQIAPKLWVHGHVHDPVDYHVGRTRVVANPLGYPHERRGKPPYEPLFVDL